MKTLLVRNIRTKKKEQINRLWAPLLREVRMRIYIYLYIYIYIYIYPPAPACQGHQGCRVGIVRLLTIIGHAFSYQAISCYLFSGPKSREIGLARSRKRDSFYHRKMFGFYASLFSRRKKREDRSQVPQKRKSSTLEFIKNDFNVQLILKYLPCENLDLGDPSVDISTHKPTKNTRKQTRNFKLLEPKKANIHGS